MPKDVVKVVQYILHSSSEKYDNNLKEALEKLDREDPTIVTGFKDNAFYIAAANNGLLKAGFRKLKEKVDMKDKTVEMQVCYRESCTEESSVCTAHSANQKVKMAAKIKPLDHNLCLELASGDVSEPEEIAERLGLDANRIWAIEGTNLLINGTTGLSNEYLATQKAPIVGGFRWAFLDEEGHERGPLIHETLYGCHFEIVHIQGPPPNLHPCGIGGTGETGQVSPLARKLFLGTFLSASPTLLEPIYRSRISGVQQIHAGDAISILQNKFEGTLEVSKLQTDGSLTLLANAPVRTSFGMVAAFRRVDATIKVSHALHHEWQRLPGHYWERDSVCGKEVNDIRKQKCCFGSDVPQAGDYVSTVD